MSEAAETIGDRIRLVRGAQPQAEFASQMDVDKNSVGRYERGERQPDAEFLQRLCQRRGVNGHWLMTGQGEMQVLMPSAGGPMAGPLADLPGDDFVLLPRYEVRAAAGVGLTVHSEQIVDHLAFKSSWVHGTLHRNPTVLILIEAQGDSMEPSIYNGDLLLIDTSDNRVTDYGIYIISLNGDLLVKRIQRLTMGGLVIMSDNNRYPPEPVDAAAAEQLRVVGRVVWRGGVVLR